MGSDMKMLVRDFDAATGTREQFRSLVLYLTRGFEKHAEPAGTRAHYSGLRSCNGRPVDGMEAFSRLAPFWAAWTGPENRDNTVSKHIARGVVNGTDPASPGFWGNFRDNDQKVCEAADIALALWISKDWIEKEIGTPGLESVLNWLSGAVDRNVKDNNWHLFTAMTAAVLSAFGVRPGDNKAAVVRHLSRIYEFETRDGLFRDGLDGETDWYNAWGFHYGLGMIELIAGPDLLSRAREARARFLPDFVRLFSPHGVPMLGRSIHYRGASAAPLTVSVLLGEERVDVGRVRRAVMSLWRYHLKNGMLKNGSVTQGYHGPDPRWVDSYSGPASPLWSLRSLIPLLLLPDTHAYWSAPERPLPVETGDFSTRFGNCRITGSRSTGDVRILMPGPHEKITGAPEKQSLIAAIKGRIRGYVDRPDNYAFRYKQAFYSSLHPFCVKRS